MLLGRILA